MTQWYTANVFGAVGWLTLCKTEDQVNGSKRSIASLVFRYNSEDLW